MAELTYTELQRLGRVWMERIQAAEKREEKWLKDAENAEAVYLSDSEAEGVELMDFNILHSNVETIVPSIYNSTPTPDIRPRFNAQDPIAKGVADIYERVISAMIDDNKLDTEIECSAQDTFVAGRGVVRVRFNADDVTEVVMGEDGEQTESVVGYENERLEYEAVSWRDYRFGPCKRFDDRPWEAFRHCISQEELEKMQDGELADQYARESGDDPTKKEELDEDVWEIWCKETGRVYFIIASSHKVVSITEDPLGVSGFFSVPCAVTPIKAVGKTTPCCPYTVYKQLAEELDLATRRIRKLMSGLKVRAIAAGAAADDIENLAEAGDNELVFAANLENLAATGGLDKAVMWWPIDTAIAVLKELYLQREQTKQAIYEITGISDIIRGQGKATETATAQQIKTQWGSLRIKKMQNLIARQVRDLFILSAEIISRHFRPETLQKISGVQIQPQMVQLITQPLDHYRIDVESDSTVRADLDKSQEEMARFLEGTSVFFQTMAPIIQQAPQAAGPVVDMYAAFARQFNLGKQAEDALEQFSQLAKQAASQPQPNPEMEKMKAEMERSQQEFQMKMREMEAGMKMDLAKFALDAEGKKMDLQIKREEHDLKRDEHEMERDGMAMNAAVAEHGALTKIKTTEAMAKAKQEQQNGNH